MQRSLSLLIAGSLMLSAGAVQARTDPEARLAKITKDRTAAESVSCILQNRISTTEIVSRTAIVYTMDDGTIYVNRPASGSNFLSNGDVLVTDTHSNQLCDVDVVRLLSNGSHIPSGSVGLGKFVPYPRPDRSTVR